ncbi:conserved exported hypothetical protein [Bradyrhizobium sp. STM 3843]|uniref:EF-hand domain-containing protein n=1 Tax=Bradyrhizobium sp. STM 3843 TaxID=551947 RepID=UPI0002404038|nr:EF-hand domain-containing protein [Bradyrhizobium sp. STM 3843]CCE09752.1 conserved exported hypothetical protein [Bradyrhizobium sp. STM 3843]
MHRHILLTTSALILACGAAGALAQTQTTPQTDQQQTQSRPMGQYGGMMGPGSMMGGGMMGHMMGGGMMGRGAMGRPFMRMMFALIDTDSDGTISLQEFQAAHERIFKAMDTNKDGKLTPEEMEAFIHGAQ